MAELFFHLFFFSLASNKIKLFQRSLQRASTILLSNPPNSSEKFIFSIFFLDLESIPFKIHESLISLLHYYSFRVRFKISQNF